MDLYWFLNLDQSKINDQYIETICLWNLWKMLNQHSNHQVTSFKQDIENKNLKKSIFAFFPFSLFLTAKAKRCNSLKGGIFFYLPRTWSIEWKESLITGCFFDENSNEFVIKMPKVSSVIKSERNFTHTRTESNGLDLEFEQNQCRFWTKQSPIPIPDLEFSPK